jgi:hypothetical protein
MHILVDDPETQGIVKQYLAVDRKQAKGFQEAQKRLGIDLLAAPHIAMIRPGAFKKFFQNGQQRPAEF